MTARGKDGQLRFLFRSYLLFQLKNMLSSLDLPKLRPALSS